MFSTIYFAAASALAFDDTPADVASKMLQGQFLDAVRHAARHADTDTAQAQPGYALLQVCADLELMLGRHEEAEETYRRAQKAIRAHRDDLRIASCRNTGWQALFRNQLLQARRRGKGGHATPTSRQPRRCDTRFVSSGVDPGGVPSPRRTGRAGGNA